MANRNSSLSPMAYSTLSPPVKQVEKRFPSERSKRNTAATRSMVTSNRSNISSIREKSYDSSDMMTEISALNIPDVDKNLYIKHLPNKFNNTYVTNQNAEFCNLCRTTFSILTFKDKKKRTHCRKCGASVCRQCCSMKLQLSKSNPQREKVCDSCCAEIQNLH